MLYWDLCFFWLNLRSPTAFGRKTAKSKIDKCWFLLLPMVFENSGWGIFCWPGPFRRARHVTVESSPVNFCQIFKSGQIWGPRQRLVEKRLCPRWTNVDYLLLRMSFEKNDWGKCCWPGPSRRAQHVAAESVPVKFCQIFKSGQIWGPRQRLVQLFCCPYKLFCCPGYFFAVRLVP